MSGRKIIEGLKEAIAGARRERPAPGDFWGPGIRKLMDEMRRRGVFREDMSPAAFADVVRYEVGKEYAPDELIGSMTVEEVRVLRQRIGARVLTFGMAVDVFAEKAIRELRL